MRKENAVGEYIFDKCHLTFLKTASICLLSFFIRTSFFGQALPFLFFRQFEPINVLRRFLRGFLAIPNISYIS